MPEDKDMEYGIIYVSLEFELAIHLCACGWCRQQTVTPLNISGRDTGWGYSISSDNLVTLSPSIGNFNMPCRSHYYLREGKIIWC
jgi:hypothetical protein